MKVGFGKLVLASSLISLCAAALILLGSYLILKREFPDVTLLKTHFPQVTYHGPKKPVSIKLLPKPPAGWVRYDSISRNAIGAVIVSEDWSFFDHQGFDPAELRAAIKEDLAERRFARGASTITMQVVKNVFLTHEKTLYRKFKEFILAIRLDRDVSKKKILETYFNVVEFGEGLYGISAASRFYFKKHPSELSPKEGAFLAMLLPSPKKYSQSFRSKQLTHYANRTVNSILNKMSKAGYIDEGEKELEIGTRLSFETAALTEKPMTESEEEALGADEEETERELDPTPVNE